MGKLIQMVADHNRDEGRIGLILGTGWGDDNVLCEHLLFNREGGEISFEACGIHVPEIEGHAGVFILGTWDDSPVVISRGRVHANQVRNRPEMLRLWMAKLLAFMGNERRLVITQAVGGLQPQLHEGTITIPDRLSIRNIDPFWLEAGEFVTPEAVLPSTDSLVVQAAISAAQRAELPCVTGICSTMIIGPAFCGKGDRKILCNEGIGTIGMSGVPELGLIAVENEQRKTTDKFRPVLLQCVTDNNDVPTHEDNTAAASGVARKLGVLISELIQNAW